MKLRKTLGNMESPECQSLMRQMETQSRQTLATWAVAYAKERYLPIYQDACPAEERLYAAAKLRPHWAYSALLRAQRARFVRFLNSQWSSCCA